MSLIIRPSVRRTIHLSIHPSIHSFSHSFIYLFILKTRSKSDHHQNRSVRICENCCNKQKHPLYCTVLYCTVLYCTVLYCTVLYCTVLYCTVLVPICKTVTFVTGLSCTYSACRKPGNLAPCTGARDRRPCTRVPPIQHPTCWRRHFIGLHCLTWKKKKRKKKRKKKKRKNGNMLTCDHIVVRLCPVTIPRP